MKFRLLIFIFFVLSCSTQTNLNKKKSYTAKGFAYIYSSNDFNEKIIKGKMNNNVMQISHQNLRMGTLIKIINPQNKESIVLKNIKRIKYPDFYKILITKPVAEKLELNIALPIIEIIEIKKNKSFIAEKAIIFNEEKKIPSKAPVASVQISNISKSKSIISTIKSEEIFIQIASFYSNDAAELLKKKILREISDFDSKKIKLIRVNNKETKVISGPYSTVNLLKNDYIKLKSFGFEELDIYLDE